MASAENSDLDILNNEIKNLQRPSPDAIVYIIERTNIIRFHVEEDCYGANFKVTLGQATCMKLTMCRHCGLKLLEKYHLDQKIIVSDELDDVKISALPHNDKLISLSAPRCRLTWVSGRFIYMMSHLTEVDLSYNHLGDTGILWLAESKSLTKIGLVDNDVSDQGAIALAKNINITYLDLRYNPITEVGAKALRECGHFTHLYLDSKFEPEKSTDEKENITGIRKRVKDSKDAKS